MSWYDYVPGAANIAGIAKGNVGEAIGGPGYSLYKAASPTPVSTAPIQGALATSPYDPAMAKQGLGLLQSAALGQQPSVAQQQVQQQGATDAANAFGLAASLGGRSPGMALRTAENSAQQTQAATNAAGGELRAGEMAQARGALVNGEGMYRGQDIDLLKQQQDTMAKNTAAQNAFKGDLINAGTSTILPKGVGAGR